MKLGTQSVNALGESAFASGQPSVLPTHSNHPFAKLVVKSELGQIVQQWLVLQNKCTLGSASSCALRCQLPGIAPYHALLVMGARQVFIRALAPKLSRNGVVVNELLLTDEQCSFEVAGHHFELIRVTKPTESPSQSDSPTNRMKFTLARSMDTNPSRVRAPQPHATIAPLPTRAPSLPLPQPTRIQHLPPQGTANYKAAPSHPQNSNLVASNGLSEAEQAKWISELIHAAMLPLERQLRDIIEPLAAVQNEMEKRARRKREQRKAIAKPTASVAEQSQLTTQIDVQPQIAHLPEPVMVPVISPVVEEQLAKQAHSLAALSERLADLKNNLGSLELAVAESKANVPQVITPEPVVVPVMSPLVESQLAQQSDSLQSLNERLNGVTSHLGSLERIVTDNFVTVINASSAPAPLPVVLPAPVDMEPVNEALRKITSVAEQIQTFSGQLNEVKSNLGSLEQIVNENLTSTNKLASAPAPASSEALQQLSRVADQLSQLLHEMNQRQAAIEESEVTWRESVRSQFEQLQSTATATESSIQKVSKQRVNTIRGTCPTSAALVLNGNLRTIGVAPAVRPITIVAASQAAAHMSPMPAAIVDAPLPVAAYAPTALAPAPALPSQASPEQLSAPEIAVSEGSSASNAVAFTGFDSQATLDSQQGFDSQAWQASIPAATPVVAPIQPVTQIPAASVDAPVESEESVYEAEAPAQDFSAWSTATEPEWSSSQSVAPSTSLQAPAEYPAEQLSEQPFAPVSSALPSWAVETPSANEATAELISNNADFIEETIEEGPVASQAVSSELPSWWTDDDKSIYKDHSPADASEDTTWNLSSAAVQQSSYQPETPSFTASDFAAVASESTSNEAFDDDFAEQDLSGSMHAPPGLSGFEPNANWAVGAEESESEVDSSPSSSGLSSNAMIAGIPFDELANEEPSSDTSDAQELASLLERFGIAREPKSEPLDVTALSQPAEDASEFDDVSAGEPSYRSELEIEDSRISNESAYSTEPVYTPAPVPVVPAASQASEESGDESGEESVEDYMKRLMARMRGGSVEEEAKPAAPATSNASPSATAPSSLGIASKAPSDSISAFGKVPLPSAITERNSTTTAPFNPEEYVPKALAPEKTRNMAAMRELANTSARSAIQVSARRRYGTAIALKLAIALTGLGVGGTLVMINGLNVNIGLIATIASFLVAMIWGFDAISTIRPLLYASTEPALPETPTENSVAEE